MLSFFFFFFVLWLVSLYDVRSSKIGNKTAQENVPSNFRTTISGSFVARRLVEDLCRICFCVLVVFYSTFVGKLLSLYFTIKIYGNEGIY